MGMCAQTASDELPSWICNPTRVSLASSSGAASPHQELQQRDSLRVRSDSWQ